MPDAFSRMEILLGEKDAERLSQAKIAVFGLGGVGSYVVEALARCGVGSLTLVDGGSIRVTDINRHLFAFRSTVGRSKVELAREYIRDIDENILVHIYATDYRRDTAELFDFRGFDYVVDATDSSEDKLLILQKAAEAGKPVLVCIDTENRTDPAKFEIANLGRVQRSGMNPIVRRVKAELKEIPKEKVKLLFSREKNKGSQGSISYIPGIAGLIAAKQVVEDLLEIPKKSAAPRSPRRKPGIKKNKK